MVGVRLLSNYAASVTLDDAIDHWADEHGEEMVVVD
jgi:hypothetical protein